MQEKPAIDKLLEFLPGVQDLIQIDEGGFKTVYKTSINGKAEVLKVAFIPTDPNDESVYDENKNRLLREIRILGSSDIQELVHLGTMAFKEFSIDDFSYIIYSEEYLDGESIRKLISNGYTPSVNELAQLGLVCMTAIQYLWDTHSTIHRDIKPGNVIKTSNPNRPFVLLDLGVAYVVGGTPLTHNPSMIPGTRYYLAPEMFENDFRGSIDFRSDLYGVALLLYEFASKINPFYEPEDQIHQTVFRIYSTTPKPLKTLRSDLPDEFCNLIDALLRKKPALRPNIKIAKKTLEKFI